MKIAILTLPLSANYGGILQCYALQTVLSRLGHSVIVLNRKYVPTPAWRRNLRFVKRFYLFYLKGDKTVQLFPWYTPKRWETVTRNLSSFVSRYINMTATPIYRASELRENILSHGVEGIVYGSDQIWRPCYAPDVKAYFGSFVLPEDGIRQVAYAASFGVNECEFSQELLQECAPLLQRFDAVSVRELSGVDLCRTCFGVEACQLIDPTLLLNAEDYVQLINQADTDFVDGDVLSYVLDKSDEKDSIIASVAESLHSQVYDVSPKMFDPNLSWNARVQKPMEQWLKGFRDAKMVVTDSFHGCVFSILFQKPFVAIGNASRGMARFTTLFRTFGLEDRMVGSWEEFQSRKPDLLAPVDYGKVNAKLQNCREAAMTFLKRTLA